MQDASGRPGAASTLPGYGSRRVPSHYAFDPRRFVALLALGLLSLLVWIAVLDSVPPHRLLTYLAFFIPMTLWIGSFSAAALYWTGHRRRTAGSAAFENSARRGGFIAASIVANLALVAARKWSLAAFLVVVCCAGIIELIAWARGGRDDGS